MAIAFDPRNLTGSPTPSLTRSGLPPAQAGLSEAGIEAEDEAGGRAAGEASREADHSEASPDTYQSRSSRSAPAQAPDSERPAPGAEPTPTSSATTCGMLVLSEAVRARVEASRAKLQSVLSASTGLPPEQAHAELKSFLGGELSWMKQEGGPELASAFLRENLEAARKQETPESFKLLGGAIASALSAPEHKDILKQLTQDLKESDPGLLWDFLGAAQQHAPDEFGQFFNAIAEVAPELLEELFGFLAEWVEDGQESVDSGTAFSAVLECSDRWREQVDCRPAPCSRALASRLAVLRNGLEDKFERLDLLDGELNALAENYLDHYEDIQRLEALRWELHREVESDLAQEAALRRELEGLDATLAREEEARRGDRDRVNALEAELERSDPHLRSERSWLASFEPQLQRRAEARDRLVTTSAGGSWIERLGEAAQAGGELERELEQREQDVRDRLDELAA